MRRLASVSVTAVLVFAAAACGDDEDRLSEEEFQDQANEICEDGSAEQEEILEALEDVESPTVEDVEPIFDDLVENIRDQIDAVDALVPPEDIEDAVETFNEDAREVLAEVEDDGPEALFEATAEDPFADVNEQAEDLGIQECAG